MSERNCYALTENERDVLLVTAGERLTRAYANARRDGLPLPRWAPELESAIAQLRVDRERAGACERSPGGRGIGPLATVREVSTASGVPPSTITRWVRSEEVSGAKYGRTWIVSVREVEERAKTR